MRAPAARILCLVAAAIVAVGLMVTPLSAQSTGDAVDFTAWGEIAGRAEETLENSTASDSAFEELRTDIADWRERLLAARTANESRIETLRNQIAALGPVPTEGETEPDEIAQRRAELNERLAQLEAPRRAADEAYTRADGLVAEIDALLRKRQARQIFELGPSPLNPALWPKAGAALLTTAHEAINEFREAWRLPARREVAKSTLPLTLAVGLVGLGLATRGRKWTEHLTLRAINRQRRKGRDLLVFAVSIAQVLVTYLGFVLIVFAVGMTGLAGPRALEFLSAMPTVVVAAMGANWLGYRIFPRSDAISAPLVLPAEQRTEGRWYATTLGLLVGAGEVIRALSRFPEYSIETLSVIAFPFAVLGGLVLFRLGQFLVRAGRTAATDDEGAGFLVALVRLGGRVVVAVGVFGPLLAAVGYFTAAELTLFPTVLTLALVGLLSVVHAPIRDSYALLTGKDEQEAQDALAPVLVSFALVICSIPLLAIIWGARPAEILEVWTRFREGVVIGDTQIAPGDFITFAIVFAFGFAVTRLVQGALRATILPKTHIDTGGRNAIVSGVGYVGIFLAVLAAITTAGISLSSLAIVAGALSVGIGFGLQNIVSNFVSGIILLVERPIAEGDWIEVGGQMGIVKEISVRSTRIETFDRTDVIVPNADFVSGKVTNWTRGNLIGRVTVSVGVAYTSDSRKVEKILLEICEAHPLVSMTPAPKVYFRRFGADALEFDCFCLIKDVNFKLAVHSELNHEIHRRFREEGIEIPFAQRDLWLRNPETLTRGANPPDALHAADSSDPVIEDPGGDGEKST